MKLIYLLVFLAILSICDDCSSENVVCVVSSNTISSALSDITKNTRYLLLKKGTYSENVQFSDLPEKNFTAKFEIRPFENDTVIIKSHADDSTVFKISEKNVWIHQGSGVLQFVSEHTRATMIKVTANDVKVGPLEMSTTPISNGVYARNVNNTVVENVEFVGYFHSSVFLENCVNTIISDNTFLEQSGCSIGVYVSTETTIERNYFSSGETIDAFVHLSEAKVTIVKNNFMVMSDDSEFNPDNENSIRGFFSMQTSAEELFVLHNLFDYTKKKTQSGSSMIYFQVFLNPNQQMKAIKFYNNIFHGKGYEYGSKENLVDCSFGANNTFIDTVYFYSNIFTQKDYLEKSDRATKFKIKTHKNINLGEEEELQIAGNGTVPLPYYESLVLYSAYTLPTVAEEGFKFDYKKRTRGFMGEYNIGPVAYPTCDGKKGNDECGGYGTCYEYNTCNCKLTHKGQFCGAKKTQTEFLQDVIDDNFGFSGAFVLCVIVVIVSIGFTIFMVITLISMIGYRLFKVILERRKKKSSISPSSVTETEMLVK